MPGLDGLEVLGELRTSSARVRVIVMSANEERDSVLDAIFAGAVGYLSKRSSAEHLRNAVVEVHAGGSVLTPSLATYLVKEFASPSSDVPVGKASLQGRELEVLRLVVQGKTDVEIGKALFISPRTVQYHLMGIRKKTGLRRRSELTRWAVEQSIG
jgi:DNA-binding NarL/FixJ family response regulator